MSEFFTFVFSVHFTYPIDIPFLLQKYMFH